MGKIKRKIPKDGELIYRGYSRDIKYNPWMRLVHGRKYHVKTHVMPSGRVRVLVKDDIDVCRIFYENELDFILEWVGV